MATATVTTLAKKMNAAGIPADYGPDLSKLLIAVWRAVAKGSPVTKMQAGKIVADLGIPKDRAENFLTQMAERDEKGNIIGILGLSQGTTWAHHFKVGGKELRTWCAWDTLFLPQLLKQTAVVESESPVDKKKVQLTIGPDRVMKYSPAGTMVSIVALDPEKHDKTKVEALWSNL